MSVEEKIKAHFAAKRSELAILLGLDFSIVQAAGIRNGQGSEAVEAALLKAPQALAAVAALNAEEAAALADPSSFDTGDESPQSGEAG